MKRSTGILLLVFILNIFPKVSHGAELLKELRIDFFGDTLALPANPSISVPFGTSLSDELINNFYLAIDCPQNQATVDALLAYKREAQLDDWMYYQLIRKAAQSVAPKADNYFRYTLYKWFLLGKSGYNTRLTIVHDKLFFFVESNDEIFDIPYFRRDGKSYVCLNIHDYGYMDIDKDTMDQVFCRVPEARGAFSYKVSHMPAFKPSAYVERDLQFRFHRKKYQLKLRVDPQVKSIFMNYPVVDWDLYFNIPLTKETYNSLIPVLKEQVKGMSQRKGLDFLMCFTRYAFSFENDQDHFGKEKRLSPEETLMYDQSDCDDRTGLFCFLVKEIYDLPMIALLYPNHITTAVKFDKAVGKQVVYNGTKYSMCDPTDQSRLVKLGQISPTLEETPYQVVYHYEPGKKF